MNRHKRIIVMVSGALFALLALLAGIITDLNDREFPQAIGSKSMLNISFAETEFSINEAFSKLEELNERLDLGLVKITPDLAGDQERARCLLRLTMKRYPINLPGLVATIQARLLGKSGFPIPIPMDYIS